MALPHIFKNVLSSRLSTLKILNVPKRLAGLQGFLRSINTCRPLSSSQSPMDSLPKQRGKRLEGMSWKVLVPSAAIVGIMLVTLNTIKDKKKKERERDQVKSLGQAAIGGEFELIDQNNKPVSSKDFLGKWILLYFGFTHCPDICPEELEKMAKVVKMIDHAEGTEALQPLFISVDPERDTPSSIGKYCADFSPRLLGLTGSIDQIKDVCHKFRIYFSMGPKEDNDYIVDHSIIMYLLNPKGEFVDYFSQNKSVDEVFGNVHMHMLKYKVQKK